MRLASNPAKPLGSATTRRAIWLAALTLQLSSSVAFAQETVPKRVLVLFWHGRDNPANVVLDEHLRNAFRSADNTRIDYYAEYLESDRFPGEAQSLVMRDYLRRKYADRRIDVIVVASSQAITFLRTHRDTLFPDARLVFLAWKAPKTDPRRDVTGLAFGHAYRSTLDLALKLHPATQQVFVICVSPDRTGQQQALVREELKGFADRVALTYLTDLPIDELLARVSHSPKRSIILYLAYAADGSGSHFTPREVLTLISEVANVPVYSSASSYPGYGIVGGSIVDLPAAARKLAEIALRLAHGALPVDIPAIDAPTVLTFDARQLRRWGIDENRLPAGSNVRFREPGMWHRYKWQIAGLISLVVLQTALIGGLLVNRARRRRSEASLRQSEDKNNAILRALPDMMFLQSSQGVYLDYYARDPGALLVPPEKFLGRHMSEVLPPELLALLTPLFDRMKTSDEPAVAEYSVPILGVPRHYEARIVRVDKDRILSIVRDVTERRQAEQALRESEAALGVSYRQIRDLAGRLLTAQEAERSRIARELHDDVNQQLAALSISLSSLRRRLPASAADIAGELTRLQQQTHELADDIRLLSHDLHPSVLQHAGLAPALKARCDEFCVRHAIPVRFVTRGELDTISSDVALCLYRVTQEALRNIATHAEAQQVRVELLRSDSSLELTIEDDGQGFDLQGARSAGGLGLISLDERVRLVRGTLEIDSRPHGGTTVRVRIAVARATTTPDEARFTAASREG
jgi:signal transduction histidine kinase